MMTMTLPEADSTHQSSGIFALIIYCANANETDEQTSCESNMKAFPLLDFFINLLLSAPIGESSISTSRNLESEATYFV